jgi:hypothetical protein
VTGLIIFATTYALIAVQRLPFIHLNRPAAALLGAVAMVVFGVVTPAQARAAVDFDVLVFLLGLMLIVGYLEGGDVWASADGRRRMDQPECALDCARGSATPTAFVVTGVMVVYPA